METEMNSLLNRYKIGNFTLSVFSIIVRQCYLPFGMTVTDRFLHCIRSNWLCATFVESSPMFVFSIFVRLFLGRNIY